jgi:hypothetical protein
MDGKKNNENQKRKKKILRWRRSAFQPTSVGFRKEQEDLEEQSRTNELPWMA